MGASLGRESLHLCQEIFLSGNSRTPENDEKLMVASYLGGLSLTYSEVGACHAISYGFGYRNRNSSWYWKLQCI